MKRFFTMFLAFALLSGCAARPAVGQDPDTPARTVQKTEEETVFVSQCIDAFLFDQSLLPETTPYGSLLSWKVEEGNAEITDGKLCKKEAAEEYEPLCLSVSWNDRNYRFEKLTLLDQQVGYVIAYFTAEGTDREQLKLAYTYDSIYWYKLNHDHGILKPDTGTKRLRDPSIVRRKDGGFFLLATQGYDNNSIYVFDSKDLIAYENERVLKLNASSPEMKMSETQAWAPEAFYDCGLDTYVIVWSSVNDGGIFYSTSDDFTAVSWPKRLMDPGYAIIDATFARTKNGFTAIIKDEREPMEEHSQIFRGTGIRWDDIHTFSDPVYERHQVEGPMIQKALEKPGWYVFADDYTRGQYKVLYTEDLESGAMKELPDTDLMIPLEKPAHGYSLPVTWKELERLLDAFDGY